ncbi:MAG TPA: AAA family ATPase [Chloroflexota bacterium]|nr:AAA family ATPase [Chloroflexota bacterium]
MGQLSISLLGTPNICHNGQSLTFRTRKGLALLAYLAVERGAHGREKLTTLFWPESDPARGRATLRSTLAYLRHALEDDAELLDRPHLIVKTGSLAFNDQSPFHLDLELLHQAWESASGGKRSTNSPQRRQLLEDACRACRGGFLESLSLGDAPEFDDWVDEQREIWHQRVSVVFDHLVRSYANAGEFRRAADAATRWIGRDRLNEAAYHRLIQMHVALGNHAAALQTFEQYRTILANELAAEPSPALRALADRIRVSNASQSSKRHVVVSGDHAPAGFETPLVGRSHEHEQLVAAYHAARRQGARTVVLVGDAGIGKTRLAAEFSRWATGQGAEILQGRAFETGGRLPYQPHIDALRRKSLATRELPLDKIWRNELSRLLPELRPRTDESLPTNSGEATAQNRLFEAVAQLGRAFAESAPGSVVVYFIDDVQWADRASLDLLGYLARRWTELHVSALLLITVRTETLTLAPDLTQWVNELIRDVQSRQIELGPLDLDATRQLVVELDTNNRDNRATAEVDTFARWLHAETSGQPFYVVETIKALLEQEDFGSPRTAIPPLRLDVTALPSEASLRGMLPRGIRDRVRSRLVQLSTSAFSLLAAGSVLSQGFTFTSLTRVSGVSEDEGLIALDEILKHRLLRESVDEVQTGSEGLYSFYHDKIRDVTYTEAGEARRRVFHRRAFERLEAIGAPAATLAHHAAAARLPEASFRYAVQAGDEAMRLFAMRDAIAQYQNAASNSAADPQLLPHLYFQQGRAYELVDDPVRAQQCYESLLRLARETGQPRLECAALNRLATLFANHPTDLERSVALLQQAARVAEHSGDRSGQAETEWNLAHVCHYAGRIDLLREHGERALSLARELGDAELAARTLNVLAYGAAFAGDLELAWEHAAEGREIFAQLGKRDMEGDCLSMVVDAAIFTGHLSEGVAFADQLQKIADEVGTPWLRTNAAIHSALTHFETAQYADALQITHAAIDGARSLSFTPLLFLCRVIEGTIQRAMLNVAEAFRVHRDARDLYQTIGTQVFANLIAGELCSDAVLAGAWDEALGYAQEAIQAPDLISIHWGISRWHVVEALLYGGHVDLAEAETEHFGNRLGYSPRYRIPYERCQAAIASWRGDIERAIEHLRTAARLAQDIGVIGEHWQIQAELGKLQELRGNSEAAVTCFRQAATIVALIADRLGETPFRQTFLASPGVQRLFRAH